MSPRHVRCVLFWRKINHFRGNQQICTRKNLDWSFLCPTYDNIFANKFLKLFIALCLVTLQKQPILPPPCLVKILTVDSWMKTYATSRNLFADRLANNGSLFFISVNFWNYCVLVWILPSQNGIQLLSSFYFCFGVFVKESAARRFIDGCLCDSSCGILQQTTGKIFLTFQSFSLRVLPPATKKWNAAAIKILLLFFNE